MPYESYVYDSALYWYDGEKWKMIDRIYNLEESDILKSVSKDTKNGEKEMEEQKPVDERFERDLNNLKKRLKDKFYEKHYLTAGDMVNVLNLDVTDINFNPFILYTGDIKAYRKDMEKLAIDKYRMFWKKNIFGSNSAYFDFRKINEALDELEKSKESN